MRRWRWSYQPRRRRGVLVASEGPDEDLVKGLTKTLAPGLRRWRRETVAAGCRMAEGGGQQHEGTGAGRRCQRVGLGGTGAGHGEGMVASVSGLGRGIGCSGRE